MHLALDLLPTRPHSAVGSIASVSRRSWVRIPLEPQNFFWALFVTAYKLLHNCENHFHLYSLTAVHSYDLYYIHITSKIKKIVLRRTIRWKSNLFLFHLCRFREEFLQIFQEMDRLTECVVRLWIHHALRACILFQSATPTTNTGDAKETRGHRSADSAQQVWRPAS